MNLILIGVIVFTFGHMFKRLVPAGREYLDLTFGKNLGKGFVAMFLVTGVILITLGYYRNEFDFYFYSAPAWVTGLMHLMMLVSVAVMQAGKSYFGYMSHLGSKFRHPMLTGLIIWSIAHLLVNGTAIAFILFGGLGMWAYAQISLLNKSAKESQPVLKGTFVGDIILGILVLLLYAVFVLIHIYLGANMYPFL